MKNFVFLLIAASVTADRDPMCPFPSDVVTFYPNRENCSIYYECYQGTKYEFTCSPPTLWNQKAKTCDYKCDFEDYSTTKVLSTTTVPPQPTRNPMCPYPSEGITFIPDRTDCTQFYECLEGQATKIKCPPNKFWNQTAKQCADTCDFGDLTTLAPYTGPTVSPEICKHEATGTYLPDPTNCRRFIECVNGDAVITTCRPGTYWNQYALTCVGGNC